MKEYNKDNFAKFIFNQAKKIKYYSFDLFYDISRLVEYDKCYENYTDLSGNIITDKPVEKTFILLIRTSGSHLYEETDIDLIETTEGVFDTLNKYKITITANCDYLHKVSFARVEKLK